MKTNKLLIGLIIVSVIQIALPLLFISEKERIIEKGKEYIFAIQPVDPYNFFQGRYVDLNLQPLSYKSKNKEDLKRYDIVYLEFEQDSIGAKIKRISTEKSKYSLKLKLYANPKSSQSMTIYLPFRKFFLEEMKAQTIESRLADSSKGQTYVHVRILNGDFVLTDLSSNGVSLVTGNKVVDPGFGTH